MKEIINGSLPHNTVMVSFDISSLSTSIPLDETILFWIASLVKLKFSFNGCSFDRTHLKKLLEFAVKDSNFIFNNSCMN